MTDSRRVVPASVEAGEGVAPAPTTIITRCGPKISLSLHSGQAQCYDSTARFILLLGGAQSGKTSFGPWWLWREIQRRGPGDYLAVSANYDLFKLKMLPELRLVFCELLRWGKYQAADRIIISNDGKTRIILRSAVAPGGLESSTALAVWCDEAGHPDFGLDAWEAIQRRLSLTRGRCLFTTTPYDLGWLYVEVYSRWKAGNPDFDVISFSSLMNPTFPREEYERARQVLPSWKFEMFYNGSFQRPAGLIYSDYDEAKHLVKPFTVPPEWRRFVGVDFGSVNTALVWLAEEPEKHKYYLYREACGGGLSTMEHARSALEYREQVFCWRGGAPSENQQRLDWQEAGVPVEAPHVDDVEAQLDRVISLFRQERLFVFESCRGVRGELGTYSRELDAAGNPTEKIHDKNKFHRLDSLRYICTIFPSTAPDDPPLPEEEHLRRPAPDKSDDDEYDLYDQVDQYL